MLTINLIPRYYFERQAVRKLMTLFGVLLLVIVVAMLGLMMQVQGKINQANEEIAQNQANADKATQLEQQAQQVRQEIEPTKQKVDYINAVMKYNTQYLPVLQGLTKYTYRNIEYFSVTPASDGASITIQGWAPSIVDAGRYLLGLYRATNLFKNVSSFTGVPGYRTGSEGGGGNEAGNSFLQGTRLGFSFSATLVLNKPITPPAYAGPGGATQAGEAGAPGGIPGAGAPPPPVAGAGPVPGAEPPAP
ncbi:MAG: hypothetical protein IT209_04570 [Armatimonadetes bacterium]|nr:hypothetical protein [Armatimonadota bacterium]